MFDLQWAIGYRLLQNRQSAALSRQRKKEYLGGLERKNNELDAENKVLKQTVYSNDVRIRELESRLSFFIKQNDDFKNLLRTSDKVFPSPPPSPFPVLFFFFCRPPSRECPPSC
jgi:hypothetical protein